MIHRVGQGEFPDGDPTLWLGPGTLVGGYELLAPIAKGGMARVWAARPTADKDVGKLVAIKTILPHLASKPEFERMFLDEARIASRIHHPNVCAPSELGQERGILYIAMEWVNGGSLSSILGPPRRCEAIEFRIAARIVADAAAGLHAAHELYDDNGDPLCVVHRDVSPQNLLISSTTGEVKVADFGVAKALGQLHTETVVGELKGKVSYMAPEQITGEPLDRRTDVFALGTVLYEATVGTQPFTGKNDHQVMMALVASEPPPPSTLVPSYPVELEQIVLRALAKDPDKRYPTAAAMRRDIESWLRGNGPPLSRRADRDDRAQIRELVRERVGVDIDARNSQILRAFLPGGASGERARAEGPDSGVRVGNEEITVAGTPAAASAPASVADSNDTAVVEVSPELAPETVRMDPLYEDD